MYKPTRLAVTALTVAAATVPFVASAQAKTATGPSVGIKTDSGTTYASINVTDTTTKIEYASGVTADKLFGPSVFTYALHLLPTSSGTVKVEAKKVVFYTAKGTLSGSATATVTITGQTQKITGGKIKLTKGTEALKGDEFIGTFTGTANLAQNSIVFHYKGKLSY